MALPTTLAVVCWEKRLIGTGQARARYSLAHSANTRSISSFLGSSTAQIWQSPIAKLALQAREQASGRPSFSDSLPYAPSLHEQCRGDLPEYPNNIIRYQDGHVCLILPHGSVNALSRRVVIGIIEYFCKAVVTNVPHIGLQRKPIHSSLFSIVKLYRRIVKLL
jgi:hypothetical protein